MPEQEAVKEKVETIQPSQDNPFEKKSQELEKKLGELSAEKQKMEDYVKQAEQLAGVIDYWSREDPKVIETLREKYNKVYGGPVVPEGKPVSEQPKKDSPKGDTNAMENGKIKEVDEKVEKMTRLQRDQVIKDFEEKHGIAELPEEERKVIRQNIEAHLNVYGQSVATAPIETLDNVLKESYKTVSVDKAVKEKGYEAAADAYRNLSGAMGSSQSRNLVTEEEKGALTEGQKGWAKKLGVDPKKVEEVNKAKDEEYQRPSAAEKRANK